MGNFVFLSLLNGVLMPPEFLAHRAILSLPNFADKISEASVNHPLLARLGPIVNRSMTGA